MTPAAYDQDEIDIETVKMSISGKLYGGTRTKASVMGANAGVKHLAVEPTSDGGYIFVCDNGVVNQGMATLGKIHRLGRKEWMRSYFYSAGVGNFFGVAETGNEGYICTGFVKRFPHNKILVVKTDQMGMSGSCSLMYLAETEVIQIRCRAELSAGTAVRY